MASQIGRLIHDQNFSIPYNGASAGGKTNPVKAQKKGGLGGRKPLGDLSNSSKPAPTQASKKKNSKNFALTEEVVTSSKVSQDASNKKDSLKALFKVQTGSRKALSDISNSGKPNLREASKKKQNMKLGVVEEENLCPSGIVEEQFLHNHQECIKARNTAMGMDHFLTTIGLDNVSSKQSASPVSSKFEPENSQWHSELEEMNENLIEDDECYWKQKMCGELESPPKSPNYSSLWKWNDRDSSINFKLMETPELRKR
ncbi:hypothetical protein FNV43_RR24050 [Rhamnella rubrinervis]|uniref:Uncharacterized protein n=1 Tax=Rhamnella rubrinervis TaxID=2594499 RepID=A0A8K0DRP2_9ROSA|nr:hypothetical protein FNV43_RR24050 [Rhamnella rubrinervis]